MNKLNSMKKSTRLKLFFILTFFSAAILSFYCSSNQPVSGGAVVCGDGLCDGYETTANCPADCAAGAAAACGNGTCEVSETNTSCPADCTITTCGNGTCDAATETTANCPADCGGGGAGGFAAATAAPGTCVNTQNANPNGANQGYTVSQPGQLSHNPGEDCLTCHTAGGSAQAAIWTIAGTIYTGPNSITPAGNRQIQVTDNTPAANVIAVLQADDCGNFYANSATVPVATGAAKLKIESQDLNNVTIMPMTGPLTTAVDGSCNKAGCHKSAGQGVVY